jgi:hypothetical protein
MRRSAPRSIQRIRPVAQAPRPRSRAISSVVDAAVALRRFMERIPRTPSPADAGVRVSAWCRPMQPSASGLIDSLCTSNAPVVSPTHNGSRASTPSCERGLKDSRLPRCLPLANSSKGCKNRLSEASSRSAVRVADTHVAQSHLAAFISGGKMRDSSSTSGEGRSNLDV